MSDNVLRGSLEVNASANHPLHLTVGRRCGVEVTSECLPAAGERERSATPRL